MIKTLAPLAALSLALVAGDASAHHAFNMYDNSKYITLKGTVKSYVWRNPHVMIDYVADDGQGGVEAWSIECSSPNIIGRHGWSASSLKAGDKIEIVIHPMKDGSRIALMVHATTPAGALLKDKD